ncbi:DUF4397 domain-containing protein [Photobacterium sanctipauli]|uniref:DUF4397 domain-containing protein n=1 Tax=Photobacterium sanctipauli TaxID=1342794 RepID=A0A2T3NBN1_9GAMM|nr:DUF4397 domain-containing protein [Photobacterium sanctipauli]PSW11354.1 DUF4397 domain-containing protein [Photobacterium sanctipauli]
MKVKASLILMGSVLMLTGCPILDDDDDPKGESKLRVTHASSDAPFVAIKLNGDVVDGLDMVDYQVGSGLLTLDSGTYDVVVEAQLTGDETLDVITANLDLAPDMQYDIFAVNNTDDIAPVVLSREDVAPGSDEVRLDVLHAHPGVGGVDIYLTTAESIDGEDPAIENLEFTIDSADLPVTVPADTYRIRITLAGDKGVAFDSGDLPLAGGSDLMISAVPNVDGGVVSPVNLLVADGDAVNVLKSVGEKATVRVVHAVGDVAPLPVDVLASGAKIADEFNNILFPEFRSLDVDAGSYDLSVASSDDNSLVVIEAPGTEFAAGSETSIYAMGKLNDVVSETIEPVVYEEDLRSVATYAKVRVVHANTFAGKVDVHASADGMFSESTVVLEAVDFTQSAVLNVPEGTYQLAVTATGDLMPLIQGAATVADGGVYTVVALEDLTFGINVDTEPSE